jgi:hypothetical protein
MLIVRVGAGGVSIASSALTVHFASPFDIV